MIKAVILDFDYSFYDESQYFKIIFDKYIFSQNVIVAKERYNNFFDDFYVKRESIPDIFNLFLSEFDVNNKSNKDLLFDFYRNSVGNLFPYSIIANQILNFMKLNLNVYIFTNGFIEVQNNKWKNIDFKHKKYIKFTPLESYQDRKPSLNKIIKILKEDKVKVNECLAIGDSFIRDIEPFVDCGARGLHIVQTECKHNFSNNVICSRIDNNLEREMLHIFAVIH